MKRKLHTQRVWGVIMILFAVALFGIALTGTTAETRDAGGVIICLPIGIYLLLTKKQVF